LLATSRDPTQRKRRKGGEHRERSRDASTGLRQRRRPQDDDAHRIVRKAEGTEKAVLANVRVARAVNRISRYS
jgi:hypothetical protein